MVVDIYIIFKLCFSLKESDIGWNQILAGINLEKAFFSSNRFLKKIEGQISKACIGTTAILLIPAKLFVLR